MQVSLKKAVTLTEVIAGAIILAIAFGGLLATFVAVRKYVKRANKRLIAANLATQQLDDLYRAVREDTWDDPAGALRDAGGPIPLSDFDIDQQNYQGNEYTVTTVGDYRRVSVTINYP